MTEGHIFVDSNILIGGVDPARENHSHCLSILTKGNSHELSLSISGQVLREFLVVATRPSNVNGLGFSNYQAQETARGFLEFCMYLPEDAEVLETLFALIEKYDLKGQRIHDANIAATMIRHRCARIITANGKDFRKIEEIEVIEL